MHRARSSLPSPTSMRGSEGACPRCRKLCTQPCLGFLLQPLGSWRDGDPAHRTSEGQSLQGAGSRPWPGALLAVCPPVYDDNGSWWPQCVSSFPCLPGAKGLRLHCRVRLNQWCQDSSCPCQQPRHPPPCFPALSNQTKPNQTKPNQPTNQTQSP